MELMELKRSDLMPSIQQQFSAGVAVEQSRAVAEAQAAMLVAQARKRDELMAYDKIMSACQRASLAESAMYAYKRGGVLVEGPSIRLAEVLARSWGNITYGLRELSRNGGESEVEAFAWDLETNTRVTRQFVVRHIRDKKGGGVALTEERDIYELAANMGQRRVRACLLELIPADIVEAAVTKCKKTIADGGGVPLEDRVRSMVVSFGTLGVTKDMIEAWLQHSVSAIVPAQLVKLSQIYQSIKTGVATREEFFDLNAGKSNLNERFSKPKNETPVSPAPPVPPVSLVEPTPMVEQPKDKRRSTAKQKTEKQATAEPTGHQEPLEANTQPEGQDTLTEKDHMLREDVGEDYTDVPDHILENPQADPVVDGGRSGTLNRFVEQLESKTNAKNLNVWAMSTVNARMQLPKEEQEILNGRLVARLAILETQEEAGE